MQIPADTKEIGMFLEHDVIFQQPNMLLFWGKDSTHVQMISLETLV